jgi:hypothetical protein
LEDNIKIGHKKRDEKVWARVFGSRDQWQALGNTVMNLTVSSRAGNFLTN